MDESSLFADCLYSGIAEPCWIYALYMLSYCYTPLSFNPTHIYPVTLGQDEYSRVPSVFVQFLCHVGEALPTAQFQVFQPQFPIEMVRAGIRCAIPGFDWKIQTGGFGFRQRISDRPPRPAMMSWGHAVVGGQAMEVGEDAVAPPRFPSGTAGRDGSGQFCVNTDPVYDGRVAGTNHRPLDAASVSLMGAVGQAAGRLMLLSNRRRKRQVRRLIYNIYCKGVTRVYSWTGVFTRNFRLVLATNSS